MTSRSRFHIHNPFHRRKRPGNAHPQTEVEEAEEGGTVHSALRAPRSESSAQPNQSTQSSTPDDLWSAAYDQLSEEERKVLSTVQNSTTPTDPQNPPQTTLLVSEVIHLTEKQYENFQKRAYGRLRESAHKIINAALSFKDIIGAVAASDPTHHAASAWAIVSLGLTISQNHYDLRSALFESSEYLADVLAHCAYIEDKFYIKSDSNNKIKGDLGNAMIRLYKAILHYAAQIQTAQDPRMGRKLLDCVTAITEHPLTKLKASVEKERDNITRWIGLVQYLHHENEAKEMLRRIDQLAESMDHLIEKFKISNLHVEEAAFYDSYVNQHEDFCLLDTRTELRSRISEWADSTDERCVFWLNGMAGTGKSTIARTVAQSLKDKGQLGATFFFKRGEGSRGNARYLVSTITRQLVATYRQLAPDVLAAIENDPNISSRNLSEQFNKLLLQPLSRLRSNRPTTIAMVIDALDECDREDDMQIIIRLLLTLQDYESVRLRIFLTSRPDLPIRLGFKQNNNHKDVVLHELPQPVIERDIRLFLKHKLLEIQTERALPPDWPGQDCIEKLVKMAFPLFIFAATICRFVGDQDFLPDQRLAAFLQDEAAASSSDLERTYIPVLNQINASKSKSDSEQLLKEFQDIVGAIVLLATPLSVFALAELTGISTGIITNRLNRFHSVLSIPSESDKPVRILHLSFRDFLVNTTSIFHVDEAETHHKIALHCFRVMDDRKHGLRRNICGLPSYGTQLKDVDRQTVDQHLSAALQYSCRYWIYHLRQSQGHVSDPEVFAFLDKHFLHWLEALSLMGVISEAVGMIDMLQQAVSKGIKRITSFLYDAKRFILKNTYVGRLAPLQLYSGLVFSPMQSTIKKLFSDSIPKHIRIIPQVEDYWSPGLQTLEGHSDWVESVAFSHDSQMVASGSDDNTVKLWDAKTGSELQTLKGHSDSVQSVAFSHDSQMVASGSDDNTVKLWDAKTGSELQTLKGHSDSVQSVAFSHDSQMIASGSHDNTIKLWDAKTGSELQTLKGHSDSVQSVAFSHDSQMVSCFVQSVASSTPQAEKHHDNYNFQVSVSDNWVMLAGENILWLPPEHRQFTASAVTEATLALGYSDGRVSIIGFHIP
ncbi:NACHT and WD40 domain protein [Aspergillus falconensis]